MRCVRGAHFKHQTFNLKHSSGLRIAPETAFLLLSYERFSCSITIVGLLGEVSGYTFVRGCHGLVTLLPAEGANLAVLLEVLQGVHDADGLVDAAAEGHIVNQAVAHNAGFVDEEEAAVGNFVALLCQHVVGCGNVLVNVGHERVGYALNAALVARGVGPGPVAELAVCGATDNNGVALLKLGQSILEADELCGAYEGEVLGVEEQYHVLVALVLLEAEVALDDAIYYSVCCELRCFLSY